MHDVRPGQKLVPETIFFYLILGVLLLPLIFCEVIVTGDGPCHFYNSSILVSLLFEGDADFYKPFLQFNKYPDPNWITNAVQIPLLLIFPPLWAEKLFFGIYLLVFAFGFRKVVIEINPAAGFLSCVGALFAWNYLLLKGFINNAWSMALWCWVLGFWLMYIRTKKLWLLGVLTILFICLYFSHPIGYAFAILSICCVILSNVLYSTKQIGKRAARIQMLSDSFRLFIITLVPNVLLAFFYLRREWTAEQETSSVKNIANDLWHITSLKTLTEREDLWLLMLTLLSLILFSIAIWQRIKSKTVHRYDGLFLLFLISIFVVFNPPTGFSGGLAIGVRLGMIPFLCLLFWIATNDFDKNVRYGTSAVSLLIIVGLTAVRLPIQKSASRYATEVISCKDHILDKSTLLVLNYDWNGVPVEGDVMPDKNWLFPHIDCYLGTYKDLIISDNYELNYWYFPLVERWETNMYKQTDKDGINFDHRPPRADINSYNRRTGGQEIDYVLMLSYTDEHAEHPYTKEIFDQLAATFRLVYTSPHSRAILYQRISQ